MPPDAPGYYLIARLDGQDVAGIGMPGSDSATTWNTYVAVDDADAAARAVEAAGGRTTSPPDEGGPGGRGAGFVDPTGAPFRVWQPRRRPRRAGRQCPGLVELQRPAHVRPAAGEGRSTARCSDGRPTSSSSATASGRRCGAGPGTAITSRRPSIRTSTLDRTRSPRHRASPTPSPGWRRSGRTRSPHWHVTFAVADRDEIVAAAVRFGATDVSGPVDTAWTRSAIVRDPHGADVHPEPVRARGHVRRAPHRRGRRRRRGRRAAAIGAGRRSPGTDAGRCRGRAAPMPSPATAPHIAVRRAGSTSDSTAVHPHVMTTWARIPRGTVARPISVPAARVEASTDRPVATACTVDGTPLSTPATTAARSAPSDRGTVDGSRGQEA